MWEKAVLSLREAAEYSGIGINRLRELASSEDCKFVLRVGNRRLFKRKLFEEFLNQSQSI